MEKTARGKASPSAKEQTARGKASPSAIEETASAKASPSAKKQTDRGKASPSATEETASAKASPSAKEHTARGKASPSDREQAARSKAALGDIQHIVDSKAPFLSGYFRDAERRVDMVIVTKDHATPEMETLKENYLTSVADIGLETEVETGEKYKGLNFVKVHAPESVLQHFGVYYDVKKYFKASHVEFIRPEVEDEGELIKICRRWNPSNVFTNFERSQIVCRILKSLAFGKSGVGINQLIEKGIFLDMYALHDGPFRSTDEQTPLELNGRQALYYCWVGYRNLFRRNPVNLIREYMGERLAFYFAFYQFYNCFLTFLAFFGIWTFWKSYDLTDRALELNEYGEVDPCDYPADTHPSRRNEETLFMYPDLPVCPKCRDMVGCPFRVMDAYYRELRCKVFLDSPWAFYIAFVTVIWLILLYIIWRRKENYWYWMWETNEQNAKGLFRPEYRFLGQEEKLERKESLKKIPEDTNVKSRPKEAVGEALKNPVLRLWIEFLIFVVFFILILIYAMMMIEASNKMLNKMRYIEEAGRDEFPGPKNSTYPRNLNKLDPDVGFLYIERFNHFVVSVIGSLNGILTCGMDILCFMLCKRVQKFVVPQTEYHYERSMSTTFFGTTLLSNTVVILFYALLKGAFYTYPSDDGTWNYPLQLGLHNCGLLYCADEIFIVLLSTFKTKLFYKTVMRTLESSPTDMKQMPSKSSPTKAKSLPCWEREFGLLPCTEDFITQQYNWLLLQIVFVTILIAVFPLGPMIVFIWNVWNYKYLARVLVKNSRRPLMMQSWGLGGWRTILYLLPFLACFTNSIYLARNNSLLERKMNRKFWGDRKGRRFFPDFFLGFFEMSDFDWSKRPEVFEYRINFEIAQQTKFCMFPGQYNRLKPDGRKLIGQYIPQAGKWYVHWRQFLFVLSFMIFCWCAAFILQNVIHPITGKVKDTKQIENIVKHYGMETAAKAKVD